MEDTESAQSDDHHIKCIDYEGEIGPDGALQRPDVSIILHISRERPVAGATWAVLGEIRNHSPEPVWIVDYYTTLTLAPEVFGSLSKLVALSAAFTTTERKLGDEVVRIDSGGNYSVRWSMNESWRKDGLNALRYIYQNIMNFAFFDPGKYLISSTIHIWTCKPTFDDKEKVSNRGSSFPITVYKDVDVEPSPLVLILGAAIGGVLCFCMQAFYGKILLGDALLTRGVNFISGSGAAVLLSSVSTILLSRLSNTDFIIAIKVRDIWGALATGFVVQWLGYSMLAKLLGAIPQ